MKTIILCVYEFGLLWTAHSWTWNKMLGGLNELMLIFETIRMLGQRKSMLLIFGVHDYICKFVLNYFYSINIILKLLIRNENKPLSLYSD